MWRHDPEVDLVQLQAAVVLQVQVLELVHDGEGRDGFAVAQFGAYPGHDVEAFEVGDLEGIMLKK